MAAEDAASCAKRAVALHRPLDVGRHFQGVNVLRVVAGGEKRH